MYQITQLKTNITNKIKIINVLLYFWLQNELLRLLEAGVVGFKCFLCPSGVREFQHVNFQDVENAIKVLENTSAVLAVSFLLTRCLISLGIVTWMSLCLQFHAEIEEETPVTGMCIYLNTHVLSIKKKDYLRKSNTLRNIFELPGGFHGS